MNVKVQWRSASEGSGAQSAMTAGTQLMLQLSVDSLGLPLKVRLHHVEFRKLEKLGNFMIKLMSIVNANNKVTTNWMIVSHPPPACPS